jgi:hypothetical protein
MIPTDRDVQFEASATLIGTVRKARALPRNKKTGAGGGYRASVDVVTWRAADGRVCPDQPVEVFVRPPLVEPSVDEPAVGTMVGFEVRIHDVEGGPTYVAVRTLPMVDVQP